MQALPEPAAFLLGHSVFHGLQDSSYRNLCLHVEAPEELKFYQNKTFTALGSC